MQTTLDHMRVYDFQNLQKEVTQRIKSLSRGKMTELIFVSTVRRATFFRRLSKSNWQPDEILFILDAFTKI